MHSAHDQVSTLLLRWSNIGLVSASFTWLGLDVVRGGELVDALLPEPNDELGIVEPGVEA